MEYIRGTQDSRGGKSFKTFSENLPFPLRDSKVSELLFVHDQKKIYGTEFLICTTQVPGILWTKTKTERKTKTETKTKTRTTQVQKILGRQPPDQFLLDGGYSLYKEGGES